MNVEDLAVNTNTRRHLLECSDLSATVAGMRVLDVGAGTGSNASWLLSHGARVTCLEGYGPNAETIRRLHPELKVWRMEVEELHSVDSGSFDVVLCSAVIEHFQDPETVLSEIIRILTRDGILYLTVDVKPSLTWRLRKFATELCIAPLSFDHFEVHKRTRFSDRDYYFFWDEQKIISYLSDLGFIPQVTIYGGGVLTNILECLLYVLDHFMRRGDEENLADHQYRMESPIIKLYISYALPVIRYITKIDNYRLDAFTVLIKFSQTR